MSTHTDTNDLLDVPAVCALLGKSPSAVSELFRRNKLPGKKLGRSWQTTRQAITDYLSGVSPTNEAEIERRAMVRVGSILQRIGAAFIEEGRGA